MFDDWDGITAPTNELNGIAGDKQDDTLNDKALKTGSKWNVRANSIETNEA